LRLHMLRFAISVYGRLFPEVGRGEIPSHLQQGESYPMMFIVELADK
jgi:hypothetical protein